MLAESRFGPSERAARLNDLGAEIPKLYRKHSEDDRTGLWRKPLVLTLEKHRAVFAGAKSLEDPERFGMYDICNF